MFELVATLTILAGMFLFIRLVASSNKRRREQMDDEVDFQDWKNGSPEDPLPPNAVPIEPTDLR